MQPTAVEKLTVLMLCDIYKKLEIKDSFDPELVSQVISSDDMWVLDWKYGIKDEGAETPPHVTAVVDTLDMYAFLRDSYAALGEAEKANLEEAVPHARGKISFPGYDGNNETEYLSTARYLVEDLDRFESMKTVAAVNSHFPVVEMYARMFEAFEPIRINLVGRLMNFAEIAEVLRASVHPDNR
ncbi:YfbU domain protein [Pseudomonas sp. 31 R 17]|uniref:YfbU family protein n=1 Tax=Pseudomonas sp. 31 R 17 TaxID=1844101 RepID=UPI000812A7B0|nr:YfbU family protein [Pseudomonas sp. 31 R 17]CRM52772.1 YfbU domain protein [Pseudomonas sp. 31 R 17]